MDRPKACIMILVPSHAFDLFFFPHSFMSHPSLSSTREFAKTFSDIVFNLICNVVWDRFFFFWF